MQRLSVHLINVLALALIFLGAQAVASLEVGIWRVSARTDSLQLMLTGLGLALLGNSLTAWLAGRRKRRKNLRQTARSWSLIHLLLLALVWLHLKGHLTFGWLKDWLRN